MFDNTEILIGKKVTITGHFNEPVVIEESVLKGSGLEIRVRLADGSLAETFLSEEEFYELLNGLEGNEEAAPFVDPEELRLLILSSHISMTDNFFAPDEVDSEGFDEYEGFSEAAIRRYGPGLSSIDNDGIDAEEQDLTPSHLEEYFLGAARILGLDLEREDDRIWRLKRFSEDIMPDSSEATKRYGKLITGARFTFGKAYIDDYPDCGLELVRPGGCLFEIVNDRLTERLPGLYGDTSVYVDVRSESPYRLYFFEMRIIGNSPSKKGVPIYGELVAVREDPGRYTNREGRLSIVKPDVLNDLASYGSYRGEPVNLEFKSAVDFVKTGYQAEKRIKISRERKKYMDAAKRHMVESFDAKIKRERGRIEDIKAKTYQADGDLTAALKAAETELKEHERKRDERLKSVERLGVARPAPLRHIGTALVLPYERLEINGPDDISFRRPEEDLAVKKIAADVAGAFEEAQGRRIEKIADRGMGFDIRSRGPKDPRTGRCDVRRIAANGCKRGEAVLMTFNEWYRAKRLKDSYWLYIVWDAPKKSKPKPVTIKNPAEAFRDVATRYDRYRVVVIPAEAVENFVGGED